jgi:MFS family permease
MLSVMAAIVSITVVGVGLSVSGPLLSLLMEADGLSSTLIGANTSVAGIAAMVAVPFATPLAKAIGVINAIAVNILLAAVCLMGFYFTDPVPSWFILRFFFSVSLAMVFVLSEFWINASANETNRGLILGIYGTLLSVGFSIGPGIIVFVGIEGIVPFIISAGFLVVAATPIFFARSGQPAMEKQGKTPSLLPFVFMVPLATMAGFVFGAIEQSEHALLPVFGVTSGYSDANSALMLVVLGLGHVVFQIPLGIWSDTVKDRRSILLICTIVGIFGSILVPAFINYPIALFATIFLFGGVIGGLYTVGLAHLGSRLTGTNLAQANAAFILCYAVGMFIGPQLVGLSMDLFGPSGFGMGLGVFFVAYLLLYAYRIQTR